ncbi:acyltransferase family protein [Pelagimonas varians]|uniref:Acyltransferase family protein n=1 Tax=Pelagimonas varians TaxID=696760 RepID=A0A238L7R7_9RHOB|nr:acyltransferase [Pelagimonas varians]PYG25497.1 fucose 4-O-acetylase-like acetyltransferase [Pelagimonas varians]SMX50356.1 Acyltransferase family protein [Pelagimonas varians]
MTAYPQGDQVEKTYKKRDPIPDYLKAISIIGVVLIHAEAPGSSYFRFCVPVFVGIWAIFLERAIQSSEKHIGFKLYALVREKLLYLFIPYAVWTVFYIAQQYSLDEFLNLPLHTIFFGLFGGFGFAGQYFFIVLFQLYLLFPIIRSFIKKNNFLPLTGASLLITWGLLYSLSDWPVAWKIGYRPFIYWLPYTIFGISIAKGFIKRNDALIPLIIPIVLLFPLELSRFDNGFASYNAISVSLASLLLIMTCAPAAESFKGGILSNYFNKKDSVFGRVIQYVGKNTYPIFLTNFFFLSFTKQIGPSGGDRIVAAIIAILGGLLVGEIFRRAGIGILVGTPVSTKDRALASGGGGG